MEFTQIVDTSLMILNVLPFSWVGDVLSLFGIAGLAALRYSKPKSQWSTKSDYIVQSVLKYGGLNFFKAENK